MAAVVLATSNPAFAQTEEERPDDGNSAEIVVTALRSTQKLRDAPASIAAFTAETLEAANVRNAGDIVNLTSGVSLAQGAVNAADVQVNIRGVNAARKAENSIAIVVDGIQRSNKAALVQSQGILEQVEVLKGPQGALYGRNATAGAFIITTKKPGDRAEGQFKASAGNNKTYTVSGVVSTPVSEQLGIQIGGDFTRTDGFYRNSFLPTALNQQLYPGNSTDASSVDSKKDWNVYGRLVWKPDELTEFDAKARYGEYRGNALNFNAILQLPGFAEFTGNSLFNIDANDHKFVYTANVASVNKLETLELSLLGKRDLGFAELRGYVAYTDLKNRQGADGASGTFDFFGGSSVCQSTRAALAGFPVQEPFVIGFLNPPYSPTTCDGLGIERNDQKDISAELRLVSRIGDPLQWQTGLYYMNIKRRNCLATETDFGQGFALECYSTDPRAPTEQLNDDSSKIDVFAIFGNVSYQFESSLFLQAALRYDREVHHARSNVPVNARTQYVGNPATGFPNGTDTVAANYFLSSALDPAVNPGGVLLPHKATFDQLQPKITVSYKPADNLMAYASWGIGFKSGGFNLTGTKATVDLFFNTAPVNAGVNATDSYKKEQNSAFEIGLKGDLLDRVVQFNLAAYYSRVKNLQAFEFFVGTFGSLEVVENIDRVSIHGIEGQVDIRATPWLNLFASANYTSSKIKKNSVRPYTVGNEAPLTPKYTINVGANVDAPLNADWTFRSRVEARVTGPTWFSTVQDNTVPSVFGPANYKNSQRDAYTTVNARLGLDYRNISISAFANNLFNKKFFTDNAVTPEFGGDFIAPGYKRYYGVEVGVQF